MPGPISDSNPGPRGPALPPWPEECGILLGDGSPRRCCRLLVGTAGDPARDREFPHTTCERCGASYLLGANRVAAWNPAFTDAPPLYERDDTDVLAPSPEERADGQ